MQPPDFWVDIDPHANLLDVATSLGVPVPSRVGGPLVDVLSPRMQDQAPERSMSKRFGSGRFPPHTDGAYIPQCPRWLILRAVAVSSDASSTELWPVVPSEFSSADREVLGRPLWSVHGRRPFLSPIFDRRPNGDALVRFDSCCMGPRTRGAARVQAAMLEVITQRPPHRVNWELGRTILIDNWRVLHARPDCSLATTRVLERVLVAERGGPE